MQAELNDVYYILLCLVLGQTSGTTASEAIFQQPRSENMPQLSKSSYVTLNHTIMIVLSCYLMLSIDAASLSNMHAAILRLPPPSSLNVCFLRRQHFLLTVAWCCESCNYIGCHGQNTNLPLHALKQIEILIDVAKAKLIARRDVQYLAALTNHWAWNAHEIFVLTFGRGCILRSFLILLCFPCGRSFVAMPVYRIKPSSFLSASLPLPYVGPTSSL